MDTDADSKNGTYRLPCGNGPQEFDDLAGRLERCGKILLHCLGKRRGQEKILRILWEQGESTQKDLQEQLGIQPGSMSEIAAKLEGRGLLERFRDGADRRKIRLRLTDQGRQWLDRQDEDHVLRRRAELFSALTGEERRTLEELLEKLGEDWTRRFARERPPEERGRKKKDSD